MPINSNQCGNGVPLYIDISQPNPILIEIQYDEARVSNGKAGKTATNLADLYYFLFLVFTNLYTSVYYAVCYCSMRVRYTYTLSVTS
jgi:hypothetical protein